MLSVEDWAEIRRLHRAEGLAIKAIASDLGVTEQSLRTWVKQHEVDIGCGVSFAQR